jgi:tRNA1Val (adenine37-N6)-methyltransferase
MLMQRCPEAEVEGIDIDEAAVEQAYENGVNAHCSSLQEWKGSYDLIVSNPPYFQNSLKNPDAGRKTARHTDTLSYAELIHHSARLLKEGGQLALILPAEAENEVRQLAAAENLFLTRVTRVYSKENKKPKRVLLAFRFQISDFRFQILEDSLVLEDEKGGRSLPYQELCRDFYL